MGMISRRLSASPSWVLAVYASLFLFVTYTCCYAYRKPFSVGLYEGETLWGFDVKLLYVMAEIVGYAVSKFIGVLLVPGMKRNSRGWYAVGLMSFSELALVGFGSLPGGWKVLSILLAGLPLGMIWGILFSYIEGRKVSEMLNVGISVALITSSGIVKSLGRWVLEVFPVGDYWMHSVTGALCYPLMLLSVWLLCQVPEPTEADKAARTERAPMSRGECLSFLCQFMGGIVMLLVFYGGLTVFRELRDSFAAEIWSEAGVSGSMVFTFSELPICLVVLGLMSSLSFVRSNRWAVNSIYGVSMLGALLMVCSTWFYSQGSLSTMWWMVLAGLGMYMGYVPFSFLIDRLIARLRVVGTMVFLLCLADSVGYLGTAGVFVVKNFSRMDILWTDMLVRTAYIVGVLSLVLVFFIFRYFKRQVLQINGWGKSGEKQENKTKKG